MSRDDIAKKIAEDLLESDMLDLNNFGNDTELLLDITAALILNHLASFTLVHGDIL